jgi:GNAT superfamily N-acetyltransferase
VCGVVEIEGYFRQRAWIDQEGLHSRVITAHLDGNYIEPVGFYSMTIQSEPEDWFTGSSPWFSTRFSKKSLLTVHLRWVAVASACQRCGIGTLLMARAIDDFYHVTDRTGIAALTLNPIDKSAAQFYDTLGFEPMGAEIPILCSCLLRPSSD